MQRIWTGLQELYYGDVGRPTSWWNEETDELCHGFVRRGPDTMDDGKILDCDCYPSNGYRSLMNGRIVTKSDGKRYVVDLRYNNDTSTKGGPC